MIDDFALIEASFLSCYGIRLRRELSKMRYDEFINYLVQLNGDTPFMKILQVRMSEKKDLPDYLHEEKSKQNRLMAKRGYLKQAGSVDDGLHSFLKGSSQKGG